MEWLIFTPLIVIVVAGIFKLLLKALELKKRKKEITCTDPDLLMPKNLTHSAIFKCLTISEALSSLQDWEPRPTHVSDDFFIACVGNASISLF